MAFRRTPKMQIWIDTTRDRVIAAARRAVARFDYGATRMLAIATAAGISNGAVYRYFSAKAMMFDAVFQQASQHANTACDRAAREPVFALGRLARMVETFSRRARDERELAWALLAEPVSLPVDADRRHFREPYQAIACANPMRWHRRRPDRTPRHPCRRALHDGRDRRNLAGPVERAATSCAGS